MPLRVDVADQWSHLLFQCNWPIFAFYCPLNICFLIFLNYLPPNILKNCPIYIFTAQKPLPPKTLPFPNFCCPTYIKTAQSIYLLPFGRLKNCQTIKNYCPKKHEPIRIIQLTFSRFVVAPTRCPFACRQATQNRRLAVHILPWYLTTRAQ